MYECVFVSILFLFFFVLILFVLLCDFIDRRQSVSQLDNILTHIHAHTRTHIKAYNICALRLYSMPNHTTCILCVCIEIGVAVTLSNIFQSYTTIYMEKQAYK